MQTLLKSLKCKHLSIYDTIGRDIFCPAKGRCKIKSIKENDFEQGTLMIYFSDNFWRAFYPNEDEINSRFFTIYSRGREIRNIRDYVTNQDYITKFSLEDGLKGRIYFEK